MAEMAAVPETFEDFSYKILEKDYTPEEIAEITEKQESKRSQRKRNRGIDIPVGISQEKYGTLRKLVVKTIPKGSLLFTYYKTGERQTALYPFSTVPKQEDENQWIDIAKYLAAWALPSIYYDSGEQSYKICISKVDHQPKYYFSAPYLAHGVQRLGSGFDNVVVCVAKQDLHCVYLNSGSEVPDGQISHKGNPHPDFNYKRIRECVGVNTACASSMDDFCIDTGLVAEQDLDGLIQISGQDHLGELNKTAGSITFKFNPLSDDMPRNLKTIIENCQDEKNRLESQPNSETKTRQLAELEKKIKYVNMLLLFIDADCRQENEVLVGFQETVLYSFGSKLARGEGFLPEVPPDGLYTFVNEIDYTWGNPTTIPGERQRITVPREHIDEFVKRYVLPNTIVEPILKLKMDESVLPLFVPQTFTPRDFTFPRIENYNFMSQYSGKDGFFYRIMDTLITTMGMRILYDSRTNYLLSAVHTNLHIPFSAVLDFTDSTVPKDNQAYYSRPPSLLNFCTELTQPGQPGFVREAIQNALLVRLCKIALTDAYPQSRRMSLYLIAGRYVLSGPIHIPFYSNENAKDWIPSEPFKSLLLFLHVLKRLQAADKPTVLYPLEMDAQIETIKTDILRDTNPDERGTPPPIFIGTFRPLPSIAANGAVAAPANGEGNRAGGRRKTRRRRRIYRKKTSKKPRRFAR